MVIADFDPMKYIDHIGAVNFQSIAQALHSDRDWVNLTFGLERVGKTTFSHIVCAIVDKNYDTKRVVFPTAELRYVILRSKPYQAINQDEGAETWLSLDASTMETRKMVRTFMQIGAKNLFLNINIPDAGMINRYMKSHRAASVVRITKRGQYAFYSAKRAKLIRKESNTKRVIWPKPNFMGSFKRLPNNSEFMKEYHRKEHDHKFSTRSENPKMVQKELRMDLFLRNTVDFQGAAKQLGISNSALRAWQRSGKLKKVYGVKPIVSPRGYRLTSSDITVLSRKLWGNAIDKVVGKGSIT